MVKVDWLSKSAIDAFRQCPKRYEFKVIKREEEVFKCIEIEVGSIVHEIIKDLMVSFNVSSKFNGRIGLPKTQDWFKEAYQERARTLSSDVECGKVRLIKPDIPLEDYVFLGRTCLKNFTSEVLRNLFHHKILQVEGGFPNFRIANVKIFGRYDLVVEAENRIQVHDWKTGKPSKDDEFQARLYFFSARQKYRTESTSELSLHLQYLNGDNGAQRVSYEFSDDVYIDLVTEISEVKGAIEATTHFSAIPSKLCHWCPFNPLCEEGTTFIKDNPLKGEEDLEALPL